MGCECARREHDTLWVAGVVALAMVVTVAVEYVFLRVHPTTDLTEGIEVRSRSHCDLAMSLASVLLPLYEDIQSPFAAPPTLSETGPQVSGIGGPIIAC